MINFDKSRLHLVPIAITDIVAGALDTSKQEFQRDHYLARLQAIRDYCNLAIAKTNIGKKSA
jgi:hypothetical protein